jgi:hypothetical protein
MANLQQEYQPQNLGSIQPPDLVQNSKLILAQGPLRILKRIREHIAKCMG